MDPKETVRQIVRAIRDEDFETAQDLAVDLVDWLERGGFPPIWHEQIQLPEIVHRSSRLAMRIETINQRLVIIS